MLLDNHASQMKVQEIMTILKGKLKMVGKFCKIYGPIGYQALISQKEKKLRIQFQAPESMLKLWKNPDDDFDKIGRKRKAATQLAN